LNIKKLVLRFNISSLREYKIVSGAELSPAANEC